MRLRFATAVTAALSLAVSACGATYDVARPDPAAVARAAAEIAATDEVRPQRHLSAAGKRAFFDAVVARIEPVAEDFCREQTEPGTLCDYEVLYDADPEAPVNALQTYLDGRPTLVVTAGFIDLMETPDDLAFILGHEAGHHVAGHLAKRRTQTTAAAVGGAVLAGALVILAASAGAAPPDDVIADLMTGGAALGAAGGAAAYSQTYELEADLVGAYVAERAGYDPARGARVFARLGRDEATPPRPGEAAFWATHPSSPERLALVDAVAAGIAAERAAGRVPTPLRRAE